MKLLLGTCVVAALGASCSVATAADMSAVVPISAPRYAPMFNWTGCYIGINAGGAGTKTNVATTMAQGTHLGNPANIAAVNAAGTGSATDSAFVGGGQIGCNFQTGLFVIGLEGDFDSFQTGQGLTGAGVLTTGNAFAIRNQVNTSYFGTLRPRAGVAFGQSLLYVTGGLAYTDLRYTQTYSDTLFNAVGGSTTSTAPNGWTVGGGWEYGFAQNWSVRAEYLYVKYSAVATNSLVVSQTGNTNALSGRADLAAQIGRVGLNYRFIWY